MMRRGAPISGHHDTNGAAGEHPAPDAGTHLAADPAHRHSPPALAPDAESREARILRARARQWATAATQTRRGAQVEVLICRLRDEQYAIASRLLRMVHRGNGLTPVPCTPAYVAGMLTLRGEVITVLDLGLALGLPGPSARDTCSRVVLAEYAQIRAGLLVDEVIGMRHLALDALDPSLSGNGATHGVAEARIVFVSLEHLLTGGQLDVYQEVK
ncbi:MAG TPA: chemotaxis protein CheW [Chloroflexota bacterium]|jgi:purine-binding chemotaxis protein CheW|nr:chemotaxis protein CheW [Chloroflexota bacterium]